MWPFQLRSCRVCVSLYALRWPLSYTTLHTAQSACSKANGTYISTVWPFDVTLTALPYIGYNETRHQFQPVWSSCTTGGWSLSLTHLLFLSSYNYHSITYHSHVTATTVSNYAHLPLVLHMAIVHHVPHIPDQSWSSPGNRNPANRQDWFFRHVWHSSIVLSIIIFSVTCSLVTAEFAAWLSDQSNACRVESPGLSVSPKPPVSHMRYQRSLSKPYEGFYGPLMRSVIARVVERYVQGRGRWFIWLVAGIYGVILCNRIWDIWVIFCGANIYER